MGKAISLFAVFTFVCCASQAAEVNPTGKIHGFNPVDQTRWVEIVRENEAILYYDKTTVKKEVIPQVRQPGEGPPVKYTFWIKGLDRAMKTTEPFALTVSCQNRDSIPPESAAEKLYNHFCFSPDAQATVYVDPNIERMKQQQLQQQQQQAALLKQQEAERRNAIIRGAAGTGLGFLQMVPGIRGY